MTFFVQNAILRLVIIKLYIKIDRKEKAMRKFYKILTLILMLVLITTAFTVVALADDETTYLDSHVYNPAKGWESCEDGTPVGTGNSGQRRAYMYAEVSADGNKYVVFTPGTDKGFNGDVWYNTTALDKTLNSEDYTNEDGTVKSVYKYNPKDYPYLVYDFDIMTPTGNFGGNDLINNMTFRTDVYGYNTTTKAVDSTIFKMVDTKLTSLVIGTTPIINELDATPYKWQHVTIVAKYADTNVSAETGLTVAADYVIDIYVDGVYATTIANSANATNKAAIIGVLPETIGYEFIRQSSRDNNSSYHTYLVSLDGYTNTDPTTWPDSDPSEWFEDKVAMDNTSISYYQKDWSSADIAKVSYESASTPEITTKSVASVTSGGAVTYYASFEAALAAANDGDTITLLADLDAPVEINKAVTIDIGMRYSHNGTKYLLGVHDFNWYSKTGYVAATVAEDTGVVANKDDAGNAFIGKYSFSASEDIYTVNWDPVCDSCDCLDKIKHILTDTTTVAVGAAPTCPKTVPVFETEDGLEIIFAGWSTSKGGEVVDLASVTGAKGEAVNLYPVYTEIQYGFEIVTSDGASEYFSEDQFATSFQNLADGATIKLHKDIVLSAALGFTAGRTITLDLNGFGLYRYGSTYTDYQAVYNEETGEYEKGDALESPAAVSRGALFGSSVNRVNFTIKTSRPGGTLYSIGVVADRLLLDGEVVDSIVTSTTSDSIFSVSGAYVTINMNGVNSYANSVIYAEHGGCANTLSFNLDGGTHVKVVTTTTGMFHLLRGGTHTIKNAVLVANSSYCGRTTSYTEGTHIKFENCDFIDAVTNIGASDTMTFTDCRINSSITINGIANLAGINRLTSTYDNLTLETGKEIVSDSKTVTYSYNKSVAFDPITLIPYPSNYTVKEVTFTYLAYNPETDVASVTWKDYEGNVIKTESLIKTEKAEAPICTIPSTDGWRAAKVTKWLDAEGNEFNLVITAADEQVYTAVRPVIDENTEYAASIQDAQLSFSYVAQFHMYFYLPVEEGMDRPTVTYNSGRSPSSSSGTVLINSQKYYVYTWWLSTNAASDDYVLNVNFEIDGVEYNQNITISALVYAEIVLSDPTSNEEAASVANMIRYIREARIASGKEVSEKFDELIGENGLYPNLDDYLETYPDDSLDTSAIADYIDSFALSIGGTPKYSISLSQKAIDLGMTKANFKLVTKDGKLLELYDYAKNGKDYETNNTKVYDLIKTFTVTVTVPAVTDAETGEVITESFTVSADYSIGSYIKGVTEQSPDANIDLAKALYSFGIAAKAYRDSVIDY